MDSFDFESEVNVNILGHIFEQSITDLEDLREGEVSRRKKDGVYYTPEFITDHICRNTIIPYLSKTSVSTIDELIQEYLEDVEILEKKIHELKILDPACGSGAFLNKAIDLLLEIFKEIQNVKQSKGKYSTSGQFQMTQWNDESEIRRIIENNIYGTDINSESIEITKLSVYLKIASQNRKLIGLSKNFQSGNSIIDDRIVDPNGIHWEDSFPEILSPLLDVQGFDIVMGNPPYLKIDHLDENDRKYFQKHFERTYMMRYDAYGLFLEKSTSLLRKGGMLGMIIPSTILNNISFTKLRKFLITSTMILQIVNLGGKIFEGVNVDSLIIIFKNLSSDRFETEIYDVLKYGKGITTAKKTNTIDFQKVSKEPNFSFEIRITKESSKILERMETNTIPLGEICTSFQGFVTGHDGAFVVSDKDINAENLEHTICKPCISGDEISRYGHPYSNFSVIYLTRKENISDFPEIEKRLIPFKGILEKTREVKQGIQPWYSLHWPRNRANFERKEKLFVQKIRNLALKRRIVATIDHEKMFARSTLYVYMSKNPDYDLRYILGILNSNLVNYSFQTKYLDITIKGVYLDAIPIPKASSKNQQPLIEKVDKILILNEKISDVTKKFTERALQNFNLKKLSNKLHNFEDLDFNELLNEFQKLEVVLSLQKQDEWKTYFEQKKKTKHDLKHEIDQLENKINKIVYDMYALTDDDIKIIERNE